MKHSKHFEFWAVAVRNIERFPVRALSIFIPLFIVMAFASVMTFIKDGISRDALASLEALPDITVQAMDGGRRGHVQMDLAKEISSNGNVRKVVPRIWGHVPLYVSGGLSMYTLMGIDLAQLPLAEDISLSIESGRFLEATDRDSAVVGKTFAIQHKVKPGDQVELEDKFGNKSTFSIVGVFASPVSIYTADMIVTDLESARKFFGYSADQYSDLGVYLNEPAYAEQVSGSIQISHKNVRALTKEVFAHGIRQAYGGRGGIFQLAWLILLFTVLLLAWAQSSSVSLEMRKEIGVLKTLGWQTLDIIEVKMLEVVIIGLSGFLGGILFGMFYLKAGAPFVKQYFLGWAVNYPQFSIPVYIEGSSLFLLFVMGLFPLCTATVFSAWLMGTIEPDNAIRG